MAVQAAEAARQLSPIKTQQLTRAGYGLLADLIREGHYDNLGKRTIGAEVEGGFFANGIPACIIEQVLADAEETSLTGLTRELMLYLFELNGAVFPLTGSPFSAFSTALTGQLHILARLAAAYGAQLGFMGIAPTNALDILVPGNYSGNPRYPRLAGSLQSAYGAAHYHITGAAGGADFEMTSGLELEGANASFQVHLAVSPAELAPMLNAARLAAALVVAASSSSPYLLGHDLWAETRIPVFEAATRGRAFFGGKDWIADPLDAFRDSLEYKPLLLDEYDPLTAFRLLHGTVWDWVRPVAFPDAITIEFRPIGTGPTAIDMAANAALFVGLTLYFKELMAKLTPHLPFEHVKRNFYQAAQYGLDSRLRWVDQRNQPMTFPARNLIEDLLPEVARTLIHNGVNRVEANGTMSVIQHRLTTGRTAAAWWRQAVPRLGAQKATQRYLTLSQNGLGPAVSTWPQA